MGSLLAESGPALAVAPGPLLIAEPRVRRSGCSAAWGLFLDQEDRQVDSHPLDHQGSLCTDRSSQPISSL